MTAPIFSLEQLQKIYDFHKAMLRELTEKEKKYQLSDKEKLIYFECAHFVKQIDKYVRIEP